MDMSAVALPARTGFYSERDRKHPMFAKYMDYRRSMSRLMVDSSDFADWLTQHNREMIADEAAKHPRYQEFRAWMIANQGGSRPCPFGAFPGNFQFWLDGGRW